MKKLWWFLQALVLVMVASAVLYWPTRPVWEIQSPQQSWLLGFKTSGDRLLLATPVADAPMNLVQVDVATGKVCETFPINCDANWRVRQIFSINHGSQVFVLREYLDPMGVQTRGQDDNARLSSDHMAYETLDTSGNSVAGPFQFQGNYDPQISPDGKWIWSSSDTVPNKQQLIEVATGTIVRSFQETATLRPLWNPCFAPDGSAVAVPWYQLSGQMGVEIIDLPSGVTRYSQALPALCPPTRSMQRYWHGTRLYVQTQTPPFVPKIFQEGCVSFIVDATQLSEGRDEPDLTGFTDNRGSEMVAYRNWHIIDNTVVVRQKGSLGYKPVWLNSTLEWLDKKCGTTLNQPLKSTMQMRFRDLTTGKTLGELSSPLLGEWSHVYSHQARYVASQKQNYPLWSVYLWDARPPLRWPWAMAAGVLSVVLLHWVKRRRSPRILTSCS